jgi:hypothetical protein
MCSEWREWKEKSREERENSNLMFVYSFSDGTVITIVNEYCSLTKTFCL